MGHPISGSNRRADPIRPRLSHTSARTLSTLVSRLVVFQRPAPAPSFAPEPEPEPEPKSKSARSPLGIQISFARNQINCTSEPRQQGKQGHRHRHRHRQTRYPIRKFRARKDVERRSFARVLAPSQVGSPTRGSGCRGLDFECCWWWC